VRRLALDGTCSCGAVQFSVEDQFLYAGYCHCSRCRRSSGSAFSAFAGIQKEKLQVTSGEANLSTFARNDDNVRSSCKVCGSFLFAVVRNAEFVHVPLGTLVDEPSIRPMFHIFVGSKALWHEITDALPQFAELPPPESLDRGGPQASDSTSMGSASRSTGSTAAEVPDLRPRLDREGE